MSRNGSTNYFKFGPTESIVQFTKDRGTLGTNDWGDYFARDMVDGRFTCVAPELERILADLNYRAGQLVGITRGTRNRAVCWKVRLVDGAAAAIARDPVPPAPRPELVPPARPARAPIPESKYATPAPAAVWEDMTPLLEASLAPKPPARATESRAAADEAAVAHISKVLQSCLCAAIDAAREAQTYATAHGFPLTFSADQVQDLASTLYIQESKKANIQAINNRDEQRRAGGGR